MKKVILILFLFSLPTTIAAQTTAVKIYLGNSKLNPNSEDCSKVYVVTRKIPKTKAVAKTTLEELFKGVTPEEAAKNYYSTFSAATKAILIKVNIKNGAAYVNFRESIKESANGASSSCGSETFYSQVESTLKQFPTIKKVYYAIEGKPEDFYDWMQVGECPKELGNCSGKNFK